MGAIKHRMNFILRNRQGKDRLMHVRQLHFHMQFHLGKAIIVRLHSQRPKDKSATPWQPPAPNRWQLVATGCWSLLCWSQKHTWQLPQKTSVCLLWSPIICMEHTDMSANIKHVWEHSWHVSRPAHKPHTKCTTKLSELFFFPSRP